MTTPTDRNRLDEEESPYLRQHADNPVNWQPWDEEALSAAREHDVPIFLSIGYAACHWCHVMEEESFQNEAIAEVLNKHFVPIKVDREERPDVDSVYMSICQRVTGRGGWPLSAWLTPEGDPFYVGTYFPPEAKRGQPGFRQLLEDVRNSWTDPEQRPEIEDRAKQWTDAVKDDLEDVPDQPDASDAEGSGESLDGDLLERAAEAAVRGADRDHGGWGAGQKFPHPGRLHLLLRAADRTGREPFREVAVETLDAMATGGMYDHLGGGFHRYTTDRDWTVPHFEKMLYDNAELPRAYLAGYQVTGDDRYRRVVEETLAFLRRELRHDEGGFFSTLDARSEDENGETVEGAYYVWTPDDVQDAVEAVDLEDVDPGLATELFRERYGVSPAGNFEGKTVLTIDASVAELAESRDLDPGEVREILAATEDTLERAREDRPRPARDEKVLAGWNGLAISAFARAGQILSEEYVETAEEALSFVRETLWDDESGRLHRRFKDGDVAIQGYLEDYAFLGRAAFDCFQATGDVDHLAFALDLARGIEAEFWDDEAGTLYFTPNSGESLVARPQELTDQSTPSSAGVAANLLAALSHFTAHDRFETVARRTVATHVDRVRSDPLQHASLVLAADRLDRGALELTLAADELPESWRETLADRYLPDRVLAWRPESDDDLAAWLDALDLSEAPPIWADRSARDGEPTVYACRSFTCSPPTDDLDDALAWADDRLAAD